MSFNAISQLLDNGISEEELLLSLVKSVPKLAKKAHNLMAGGWKPKDILGIFSKEKNVQHAVRKGLKPTTPGEIAAQRLRDSYNNIPQNQEQESKGQIQNILSKSAQVALPLGAAKIAAPMAQAAMQHAIPKILQGLPRKGPQETLKQANTQAPQNIQTPHQPPISPTIPQAPVAPQAEGKIGNVSEILNKTGSKSQIDALIASKNGPQEVSAFFEKFRPKEKKAIEKELGIPFDKVVEGYISENPVQAKPEEKEMTEMESLGQFGGMGKGITENFYKGVFESLKEGKDIFSGVEEPLLQAAKPAFEAGQIKSWEDLRKFAKYWQESKNAPKIEKGSVAAAPQGVGEVKEIRNGQAIIDVDGKKHKVPVDELIESPIPEKELDELYEELIGGIEKKTGQEISKNVEWAGYDPKTNELAYKPHGSDRMWVYDEISQEDRDQLTSLLTKRKTTGENHIGVWEKDTVSPIGAAMSTLIKRLQAERGGKGNEYKNRYDTIYDALEPAKKALKAKHAERKKKAKKPRLD